MIYIYQELKKTTTIFKEKKKEFKKKRENELKLICSQIGSQESEMLDCIVDQTK